MRGASLLSELSVETLVFPSTDITSPISTDAFISTIPSWFRTPQENKELFTQPPREIHVPQLLTYLDTFTYLADHMQQLEKLAYFTEWAHGNVLDEPVGVPRRVKQLRKDRRGHFEAHVAPIACTLAWLESLQPEPNPEIVIVGLTHDLIEDTNATVPLLQTHYGLSDGAAAALLAVTKPVRTFFVNREERMEKYASQLRADDWAKKVKAIDNSFNIWDDLVRIHKSEQYPKEFAENVEAAAKYHRDSVQYYLPALRHAPPLYYAHWHTVFSHLLMFIDS